MGISTIWIYGEAANGSASSTTLELLAKARELAGTVEVIIHGDAAALATELGAHGATSVQSVGDLAGGLAGPRIASAIAGAVAAGTGPDVVLCATTYDGRDIAGRLSAKLDAPVITNVVDLVADGDRLLGVEPVFGGVVNVTTGFTGDSTAIFLVRPKSLKHLLRAAQQPPWALWRRATLAIPALRWLKIVLSKKPVAPNLTKQPLLFRAGVASAKPKNTK